MDQNLGSFKLLEKSIIKATYNLKIGEREIEPGEVIASFDSISVAGLQEITERVNALGGKGNPPHVFWETTKEERIAFSQGVFSKEHLALLSNSKLNTIDSVIISEQEILESDESKQITLKNTPAQNLYVYDYSTGDKINYTISGNIITIDEAYKDVIVFYDYNYTSGAKDLRIGHRLMNGFVSFEGRTRVKDDKTGQVITGIIKIPKLKLVSDLSIRLGDNANPIVANFLGIGYPVGSKGEEYVSEILFLNSDIDSDF